ncbi:MAG: tetratricopeptide repeat protein [Lentisphaeria bacterium]|nr:tetratricopeptide repeat protein [Lentisphaeria bacterium]
MREFGQRVTGWCAVFLAFLLPIKFGSLSLMPEQPPMFPVDVISLLVISWPPHFTGIAGALLLLAGCCFFPVPRLRAPGSLPAFFWGFGLPLAVLPGFLNNVNFDYAWCTFAHWWGIGALILGYWWIFSSDGVWKRRCLGALAAGTCCAGADAWRQYLWGFDEMAEMIRKQREGGAEISQIMEIRILDGRIFGTLGSSNTLAGFLLLAALPVLMLLRKWGRCFEPEKVSVPLFVLAGAALLGGPFLMTRSRGAWLCAFLTGAVWFFTLKGVRRWMKLTAAALGLLLLLGGAAAVRASGRGFSSGMERLDYLRTVGVMCAEHPWAGGGWGEFFHRHMKIKLTDSDESARSPHNLAGSFAAQAGIPAGLIAAAAMILLLRELFRRRKEGETEEPLFTAVKWSVTAFLLHSCMEVNDAIPASMVSCVLLTLAVLPDPSAGESAPAPLKGRLALCAGVLALLAGAFLANGSWLRSEAAFDELDQLLHPRTPGGYATPPDPAEVARRLERVESLRPRSPYAAEMTGDLLFRLGDVDNAAILFEKARRLDPGRPAAWRRLAAVAFRQGDREKARLLLGRARELFPADPKNREEVFFKDPEGKR